MIDDLKPYPAMKDSGVPWLGEVPEHWEVVPNRAVFTEIKERNHSDSDMLSVTITKGVIRQRALLEGSSKKDSSNQDKSAYKLVRPGDIAYNKMRAWQGAVGVSESQGIVSPAYVVQRPREGADPRYLHYLLRTPAFAKEAERWSYGITSDMWSLRPEHFRMIYSCLPPLPEQGAIVRFVDHADRRIRRYIRAKQKLIKLLEEQKQAIIHRAVTRGLDPNVRLTPSGVEWRGEVPEHWEVLILGRGLTAIGQGWSPVAAEGQISPDQWAVLTLSSVRRGRFNADAIKPVSESARIPGGIRVCDGDLLLTRSNTRELVGDVCIVVGVRPRTVMCDLIYRLTPDAGRFDSTFLMHQLLSRVGRRQIEQDARGSSGTMPKISQRHIRSWRVLSPPLDEQRRISALIVTESERVNAAADGAQQEITFLREYRTRLISDVVTGKLDVREAAARLPVEIHEREPLDDSDSMGEATESAGEKGFEAEVEKAEA
ncbi:restriction endonuclease subunit S [soil metagenome]